MDKCDSDAEFDSYWDYEAKNKNRNRIRVGRQYQASVPPLLKPGEKDGRKSEDLETLQWKPNQMNDQEIDQYLCMAKAVTSFAKAIENCRDPDKSSDNSLQVAIKGLTEFVTSHHPCHHDAGCKVPVSCSSSSTSSGESSVCKSASGSDWSAPEAHLFAQAIESCGKNFCTIKKEYLPWKPVRSLIEYYYGKNEKSETVSSASVPCDGSNCKVVKEEPLSEEPEPVAGCSRDNLEQVPALNTKEEPIVSEVKQEAELQAISAETSATSEKNHMGSVPFDLTDSEDPAQSTVGSLKFFLGGRLVLKLNAQQDGSAGTKCQWVQSNDTPKHSHQVKKVKHRRKVIQEVPPAEVAESPKHKKKSEDTALSVSDGAISATKKLKLRPYETDTGFSPLCSVSWTPPVADGHDPIELEDGSSKTSEGCVSPVVATLRSGKAEVSRTDATPVDSKRKVADALDVQERKPWARTDSSSALHSSQSDYTEDYVTSISGSVDKCSPKSLVDDVSYSYEVLNHKSALTRMRSSCFLPRAAHSSSPSAKLFNKWPSPSAEFSDKLKSSPNFHSPNSRTCSTSSESSGRDFVLDLSSRLDTCESRPMSHEICCQASPSGCMENCSSSEGSPHTPCSANDCNLCCKSSNCSAYHTDVPPSKGMDNQLGQTNFSAELMDDSTSANESAENKLSGALSMDDGREGCLQCSSCYTPSTSCVSPKCCKSYSSKEETCNKKESVKSPSSSPNPSLPVPEEVYSKKVPTWFGTPSLVHLYPHCYPYYVTYGVNQSSAPNSTSEIPLDLSNNGSNKEEKPSENVPAGDLPQNSDAMDRGMLYQLLKNKVTK